MQGDGEFDRPEIRTKVPAGAGNRLNEDVADLFRQHHQLVGGQRLQVPGEPMRSNTPVTRRAYVVSPVGVRMATHSTWCVIGKASNARSSASRQPASPAARTSRASVAGSHDT